MKKKIPRNDATTRIKELVEAVAPIFEKMQEDTREKENRRIVVFRDAFGKAQNAQQRTALAVAYLSGAGK